MNIIEVSHLVKEYKKIKKGSGLRGAVKNLFVQKAEYVRAVDGISFNITKGDIVGCIGPNGAGKVPWRRCCPASCSPPAARF